MKCKNYNSLGMNSFKYFSVACKQVPHRRSLSLSEVYVNVNVNGISVLPVDFSMIGPTIAGLAGVGTLTNAGTFRLQIRK